MFHKFVATTVETRTICHGNFLSKYLQLQQLLLSNCNLLNSLVYGTFCVNFLCEKNVATNFSFKNLKQFFGLCNFLLQLFVLSNLKVTIVRFLKVTIIYFLKIYLNIVFFNFTAITLELSSHKQFVASLSHTIFFLLLRQKFLIILRHKILLLIDLLYLEKLLIEIVEVILGNYFRLVNLGL